GKPSANCEQSTAGTLQPPAPLHNPPAHICRLTRWTLEAREKSHETKPKDRKTQGEQVTKESR
ncbi:unnamed protein product, partial [Amoebophrya sp. A25]